MKEQNRSIIVHMDTVREKMMDRMSRVDGPPPPLPPSIVNRKVNLPPSIERVVRVGAGWCGCTRTSQSQYTTGFPVSGAGGAGKISPIAHARVFIFFLFLLFNSPAISEKSPTPPAPGNSKAVLVRLRLVRVHPHQPAPPHTSIDFIVFFTLSLIVNITDTNEVIIHANA